jgi:N-acetylmuramoyl-L-alanine amidase
MINIKRVLPVSKTLDQPMNKEVTHLAVHCSATPSDQDIGAVEIDKMHRLRGFLRIGYHYVIRRDGTIEKGREDNQAGAHTQNFNSKSIGICMVGGVERLEDVQRNANGAVTSLKAYDNFTETQKFALRDLLKELKVTYPKAIIQGHRDFPKVAKDCPSFSVKDFLRDYKV